jgi:hypothetical protein
MVYPVPGGVGGEGKVTDGISVDFVIELEEDAEACLCEDGMRRFWEDVIV